MKFIAHLLIVMLLAVAPACSQERLFKADQQIKEAPPATGQKKYIVSGKLLVTSSYCGGAYPPDELLEELRTPKPFAGYTVYVRPDTFNNPTKPIIDTITANADGTFSLELPPGKYSIILAEQTRPLKPADFNKGQWVQVDKACMEQWWLKPHQAFEISNKNLSDLDIIFHKRCFVESFCPCVQYIGPMPP